MSKWKTLENTPELLELYKALDDFEDNSINVNDPEENGKRRLKLHYKQKHKLLENRLNKQL